MFWSWAPFSGSGDQGVPVLAPSLHGLGDRGVSVLFHGLGYCGITAVLETWLLAFLVRRARMIPLGGKLGTGVRIPGRRHRSSAGVGLCNICVGLECLER